LKQQGIYKGEVDGKFGKGTASAIGAYQKKKKLPETGVPDRRTLLAIYQEWK
jgi:peptidoglycan hydrolase-like protein with peptidoglycan-binding domain